MVWTRRRFASRLHAHVRRSTPIPPFLGRSAAPTLYHLVLVDLRTDSVEKCSMAGVRSAHRICALYPVKTGRLPSMVAPSKEMVAE
ncbi:hypothetical protein NMY22_g6601 [Coprinellus aureogranulatus]|nr:hypothetical protein NMY22_g6601 [Coprinellus aureogranulatus]